MDNMMEYQDETDSSSCYSSIIPYWTDGTSTVVGDKQTLSTLPPTGRDACIPMDLSEKFENKPTKAQVNTMGQSVLNSGQPYLPAQNITVSFVRLQDTPEYAQFSSLLRCSLCDTIKVIFPDYQSSGTFKIVRTVWNVLEERYDEMELGDLSISLSEALGINDIQKDSRSTIEQILEQMPVVDRGTVTTIGTVAANTCTDVPVSFSKTFEEIPTVMLTIRSSSTAGGMGRTMASAINATTTGFTLRFFNGDSSDRTPYCQWLAVGK